MRRLLALASMFIALGCSSADSTGQDDAATDPPDTLDGFDAAGGDGADVNADTRATDAATDTRTTTDGAIDTHASSDAPTDAPTDLGVDAPRPDAGPKTELVIMPFGDSITGEPHTYREPLYGQLTAAGCTVRFVGSQTDTYATIPQKNHEGHPGFTIGDVAKSTDAWIAANPARYVLMLIGTNDIAWWYAGTAAEVADAHAALLDRILADSPDTWVVVGSLPPQSSVIVEPNKYDRAVFATTVNAEIKKRLDVRIAAGKNVRFADVNAALTVADLRDGIHPTTAGYAKLADVWFRALKPIAGCLATAP